MLWKDHNFHIKLFYFCNETLEGNKPSAFSKSNMITILKKGDLSQPSSYRGITLTSIASKVYNSLLLTGISKHMEPILRRNQNGFCKGGSTLPQISALGRITEEINIANRRASMVFVDFSKPFSSVKRNAMFHILHFYDQPDKIISVSKSCMRTQKHLFLVQMEPLTFSSELLVYFKEINLHHTSSL